MAIAPVADSGAYFDASAIYRYRLWRAWDAALPCVCFVMLNPGAATADVDDPTIRRCIRFAADNGFGRLEVVNLFAYRSSYPAALKSCADPAGPENKRHISEAVTGSELVIAAWGNAGAKTWTSCQPLVCVPLHCLGVTKGNHPRHPLYVRASTAIRTWNPIPVACSPAAP